MTTPQNTNASGDGFTNFMGGDCPVSKDSVVEVATYTMGRMITFASKICWTDVDKYKVLNSGDSK